MKRVEHLSPVTIRHHVGALARLLDQFAKRGDIPSNPLRALSRGYSTYSRNDIAALPKGKVARIEQERDRRLSSKEEENIRKVLDGSKETKLVLPERDALTLMFIWALESAMRLQEIYTLDHAQVDLRRKTFFLDKTKNGDKRQVPMTSIAITAYQAYRQGKHPTGLVFPFWDGEDSIESRKRATAKLSQQFARIFEAAQCGDLRFHDLRHEATSRFFERSTLSDTEIAKITGHRSPRMLMRYANLRGSVLAGRLW
jgi:integrase